MFRVDKKKMEITEAEGWFHNRFFLANLTGTSEGSEPIQGRIYFENRTHPLVYAQSMGHGVRCFQKEDVPDLKQNVKVFRFSKSLRDVEPSRKIDFDCTYTFQNFDEWYKWALGPFGSRGKGQGVFEETINIGKYSDGKDIRIGRFIAGIDYDKISWSRPKPPWSWDDGWDHVPIFVWHFFPDMAFRSHFGVPFSDRYVYNQPVEKTFKISPDELKKYLSVVPTHRRGKKWERLMKMENDPSRKDYFHGVLIFFKKYVNRLFNALG
jgi:hypothetical protein